MNVVQVGLLDCVAPDSALAIWIYHQHWQQSCAAGLQTLVHGESMPITVMQSKGGVA